MNNIKIYQQKVHETTYYQLSRIVLVDHVLDDKNVQIFKNMLLSTYCSYSFGDRDRSPCLGLNIYTGLRGMRCVRPTPRMSVDNICLSQYTNNKWNFSNMPMVQKTINKLANDALYVKRNLVPLHEYLVDMVWIDFLK